MTRIRNAFTVDVEDYCHVSAFEQDVDRSDWDRYEGRVTANTRRLLELLRRRGVRATFFVLGWVARRQPDLVREIHAEGHEIAAHSFWHRLVYRMSREEFRDDLVRVRDLLGDLTGAMVAAYRAPSFSITGESLWALDVLAEEGFRFDSSVFPVHHDRYGIPGANPAIHRVDTPAGPIWEFPISVRRVGWLNVPVSGGGYFRLYPLWLSLAMLRAVNRKDRRPFVFYVHPWELDPGQPRIASRSRLSRVRHYWNLSATARRLEVLLDEFSFGPLCEVVEESQAVAEAATARDP